MKLKTPGEITTHFPNLMLLSIKHIHPSNTYGVPTLYQPTSRRLNTTEKVLLSRLYRGDNEQINI